MYLSNKGANMFKKNKPVETFLVDPKSMGKDDVLRLPENVRKIRLENSNDRLFYRVYGDIREPDAQIIISDPNKAVIIKDGISSGILSAGKYDIYEKGDISKGLFGKAKLKEAVVVDVIVYNPSLTYEGFWGTSSPIPYRDPETQIPVDIKGRGKYDIRIADVAKFHERLVGSDRDFSMDKLLERVNSFVLQVIKNEFVKVLHELHLGYIDIPLHELEIAERIQPTISEMLNEQYGLFVPLFAIEEFFIDEEKRKEIEQYLKDNRDEEKFKKDAKEIASELERLDDKNWERQKYLIGLKREDYDKYLEVVKILGWEKADKNEETKKSAAFCPKCGAPIENGQSFCSVCGAQLEALERTCPHCGKTIKSKGKYCPHCGKEL